MKIGILGAGPAGLAAGWRLLEHGFTDFRIYEKSGNPGGLAGSRRDSHGFSWDHGGHVFFSHFPYVNGLLEELMPEGLNRLDRSAWIHIYGKRVPYPFQNHLRYLPPGVVNECLDGLSRTARETSYAPNFKEWIYANMGAGIARHFMIPYNEKVWTHPLEDMSAAWISDRVSRISLKDVREHLTGAKDSSWGPNASFLYPKKGGFGEIFRRMAGRLERNLVFGAEVGAVNIREKKIVFAGGPEEPYDVLISTLPLTELCASAADLPSGLLDRCRDLKFNSMHVAGIGIEGPVPDTHCWTYFPEPQFPFTRVTMLSTYASDLVPEGDYHSYLCECPYSSFRPVSSGDFRGKVIEGLEEAGLLDPAKNKVVSFFYKDLKYAYPIPSIARDKALQEIHAFLEPNQIYSRGRFGAWLYELGNADHSLQQGKEIADRVLLGTREAVFEDKRFSGAV